MPLSLAAGDLCARLDQPGESRRRTGEQGVVGAERARQWQREGLLGAAADAQQAPDLAYYTTAYRQDLVFHSMKAIVREYLNLWYI